jgi:hypothetical protein
MELEITSAFPTRIGRLRIPDADAINRDLYARIIAEGAEYSSLGRSNIGGWHSRPGLLSRRDTAVSALTVRLTWALRRIIDASAVPAAFKGTLSVVAWATICRAGGVPCTPFSSGKRMVRSVLRGFRNRQPGSAAHWCLGVPRSARGRRGRDCARRSVWRTPSGSTARRTTCSIPEPAISLGSSLPGPYTSCRHFVQCHDGFGSRGQRHTRRFGCE